MKLTCLEHDLKSPRLILSGNGYLLMLTIISHKNILYSQAVDVFGLFLMMDKDKNKFENWMKNTFGASTEQSKDCYQCLYDWSCTFLN